MVLLLFLYTTYFCILIITWEAKKMKSTGAIQH